MQIYILKKINNKGEMFIKKNIDSPELMENASEIFRICNSVLDGRSDCQCKFFVFFFCRGTNGQQRPKRDVKS